jgi:hypothetical protein
VLSCFCYYLQKFLRNKVIKNLIQVKGKRDQVKGKRDKKAVVCLLMATIVGVVFAEASEEDAIRTLFQPIDAKARKYLADSTNSKVNPC